MNLSEQLYKKLEESSNQWAEWQKKVIILGGGPNRIGQGIEFDYCCVHAAYSLTESNFDSILRSSPIEEAAAPAR